MSNIPAARRLLVTIAKHLDTKGETVSAEWIRYIVDAYMTRRPALSRAPSTSTTMTEEIDESIRDYKSINPVATQAEIATAFRVNPGRVSEALNGLI